MSDTTAGPPAAEPSGSPSVPASTHTGATSAPNGAEAPSSPPPAPSGGDLDSAAGEVTGSGPAPEGSAPSSGAPRRRRRRPAASRPGTGADAEPDASANGVDGATGDAAERPDDGGEVTAAAGPEVSAEAGPEVTATDVEPDDPTPLTGAGAPRNAASRPKIGDTRPARVPPGPAPAAKATPAPRTRASAAKAPAVAKAPAGAAKAPTRTPPPPAPVPVVVPSGELPEPGDDSPTGGKSRRRSGRERRGRPVGRYMMCVHVRPHATQIAVLEGRTLVEHYVSRASDDATQIDGNVYRGRVQNVLPGMEAAFIDISTPKNAVLYRGDVRYDRDDIETAQRSSPRIEEMLKPGQVILCQVTKNPIGAKGARLTQEVSLPGRFVVMVPNSTAFGISKRLDDNERKRLRRIVDEVRPPGHGLIVRTAAEGASQDELRHDVDRLVAQWAAIEAEARRSNAPGLLYREPDLAVRIVREEFNREYRGVAIDDEELFAQVRDYVGQVNPELLDRVEYYDPVAENLPVFERFHVHEQLHKALDRKVWLPSGGSLIIERTEALTVIDVNTGKNVGTSNLEETVYRNNLEAAEEIARQLRLRDIGGIIVIDFIDMEIRENRDRVGAALRSALARDKTRTQVFDISELGLVEMTRKRVSEGLVESLSTTCTVCGGRGIVLDDSLL